MKLIILLIISLSNIFAFQEYEPQNSSIYCNEKSNLMVKKIWTSQYSREELYCLDKSSWDSSCLVLVKCDGQVIKIEENKKESK